MSSRPSIAALLVLTWSSISSATTVQRMQLEELFLGSDFFGIVECETAGEIVAGYRVVEAWKGRKVGDLIRIKTPPNVWGPRMPAALVGERYLVAAYVSAPARMMSTTSGPGEPVWWRGLSSDYATPLFQGREHLDSQGLTFFGSGVGDLEAFRKKLAPLTRLSVEDQRLELARYLAKQHKAPVSVAASLKKAKTSTEALTAIMQWDTAAKGDEHRWATWDLLRDCFSESDVLAAINAIPEKRRGLVAKEWLEDSKGASASLPDGQKLRAALRMPTSDEFGEALNKLPKLDCAFVAEWIAKPNDLFRENGYIIGSIFAQGCGAERAAHLRRVAESADSALIRVAAAVHLLHDDEARALPLVRSMAKEGGFVGGLAALALARRGDKAAVPVLLKLLGEDLPSARVLEWHQEGLMTRFAVLLSNSAKGSKVPTPLLPPGGRLAKSDAQRVAEWWSKNQARVTLVDPWLPELAKQKAD